MNSKKLLTTCAALFLGLLSLQAKVYPNEALSSTPVLISKGARQLDGWNLINLSNAPAYLHFYDAATAGAVTVGTTTQVYEVAVGQSGAAYQVPLNFNSFPVYLFQSGIVVAVTTSPLSSGSTAPSTAMTVFIHWH